MDYERWYENISAPFRGDGAKTALRLLDKGLVYLIAAAYAGSLVFLALSADARLLKAIAVPAMTFAFVSVLRAALDKPRPYEVHDIDPIIVKDTRGKSMPSRHVASAVVISCVLCWLFWPAGAISFAPCILVCATRVIGGVHFPRDVFAAVACACVCAAIGLLVAC